MVRPGRAVVKSGTIGEGRMVHSEYVQGRHGERCGVWRAHTKTEVETQCCAQRSRSRSRSPSRSRLLRWS